MKRTAQRGGLIVTSALTLALFSGPANAASAAPDPGGDFFLDCFKPVLVDNAFTMVTEGSINVGSECSRDTIVNADPERRSRIRARAARARARRDPSVCAGWCGRPRAGLPAGAAKAATPAARQIRGGQGGAGADRLTVGTLIRLRG
jgi:hypothetical protein